MTEQTQAPQLSLQDVAATVQVIDIACQRGAIRGPEMSGVGQLRDKIVAFLESQGQQDPGVPADEVSDPIPPTEVEEDE